MCIFKPFSRYVQVNVLSLLPYLIDQNFFPHYLCFEVPFKVVVKWIDEKIKFEKRVGFENGYVDNVNPIKWQWTFMLH